MVKLLHFADAHIDLARQGRRDPQSGLPLRVLDFLHALDFIIDAALDEKVDLVIFAGDAYRDRSPAPTYQREWGKRMIRLSQAGIETLLVVGNHDFSPAAGRAHTLQEYETLGVPHIRVISKPCLLKPVDLGGLPLQVIGIPWIHSSVFLAKQNVGGRSLETTNKQVETQLTEVIESFFEELDPKLPAILTGHMTVQGAAYGNERSVMLGRDVEIAGSLVRDERLDYVALGHIHKGQNLNKGGHHPVIYPGSIERIDFGEMHDPKTYVIAQVERNHTEFFPHDIPGRRFIDLAVKAEDPERIQQDILAALPKPAELVDAIVRLVVEYPRELEALIDEPEIRRAAKDAFEFHFIRRPQAKARLRLAGEEPAHSLSHSDLLKLYWQAVQLERVDVEALNHLAAEIFQDVTFSAESVDPERAD